MGATGLLLCVFLVLHLAGNLNVYGGPEVFNGYAQKLHSLGPLLVLAEIGLLILFVIHIAVAVALTTANRAARGAAGYERHQPKQHDSPLSSQPRRWMLVSGGIVLLFLIYHVAGMKFGLMDGVAVVSDPSVFETAPTAPQDVEPSEYRRLVGILSSPLSVIIYLVGVIILGFHLSHGFASGFRSLGIAHPRYTPMLRTLGLIFAIVMTIGFASIPIYILLSGGGLTTPSG